MSENKGNRCSNHDGPPDGTTRYNIVPTNVDCLMDHRDYIFPTRSSNINTINNDVDDNFKYCCIIEDSSSQEAEKPPKVAEVIMETPDLEQTPKEEHTTKEKEIPKKKQSRKVEEATMETADSEQTPKEEQASNKRIPKKNHTPTEEQGVLQKEQQENEEDATFPEWYRAIMAQEEEEANKDALKKDEGTGPAAQSSEVEDIPDRTPEFAVNTTAPVIIEADDNGSHPTSDAQNAFHSSSDNSVSQADSGSSSTSDDEDFDNEEPDKKIPVDMDPTSEISSRHTTTSEEESNDADDDAAEEEADEEKPNEEDAPNDEDNRVQEGVAIGKDFDDNTSPGHCDSTTPSTSAQEKQPNPECGNSKVETHTTSEDTDISSLTSAAEFSDDPSSEECDDWIPFDQTNDDVQPLSHDNQTINEADAGPPTYGKRTISFSQPRGGKKIRMDSKRISSAKPSSPSSSSTSSCEEEIDDNKPQLARPANTGKDAVLPTSISHASASTSSSNMQPIVIHDSSSSSPSPPALRPIDADVERELRRIRIRQQIIETELRRRTTPFPIDFRPNSADNGPSPPMAVDEQWSAPQEHLRPFPFSGLYNNAFSHNNPYDINNPYMEPLGGPNIQNILGPQNPPFHYAYYDEPIGPNNCANNNPYYENQPANIDPYHNNQALNDNTYFDNQAPNINPHNDNRAPSINPYSENQAPPNIAPFQPINHDFAFNNQGSNYFHDPAPNNRLEDNNTVEEMSLELRPMIPPRSNQEEAEEPEEENASAEGSSGSSGFIECVVMLKAMIKYKKH